MKTLTIVTFDELHEYREYLKDVVAFSEQYHCGSPETPDEAIGCATIMEQVFAPRKKALWEGLARKYSLDLSQKMSINTQTGAIFID